VSASDVTQPEEFGDVFAQPGVVVVGGHAVNLWASYYAPSGDDELRRFAPYVSKDGDIFLRDKDLARAVAAASGWKFRNNPEVRSPVLGHIYLEKKGRELTVDVLRAVRGLTESDLGATETIRFGDGRNYSVPAPEVMLKAKLANLESITQENRADQRHVRILVVCCRHYLADVYRAALDRQISERDAVDRFGDTLKVIRAPHAVKLAQWHKIDLASAIPGLATLKRLHELPRLLAFYEHQIPVRQAPKMGI
jgi:hypothetical protein